MNYSITTAFFITKSAVIWNFESQGSFWQLSPWVQIHIPPRSSNKYDDFELRKMSDS